MALKSYKPTTPGQRGLVLIDRSELWKGRPVKSLTEGLIKTGGRNNTGRVTSWHKGGGAKRLYRIVDFKRRKFDVAATVERIEYDPNRTAFIALVKYADGEQTYDDEFPVNLCHLEERGIHRHEERRDEKRHHCINCFAARLRFLTLAFEPFIDHLIGAGLIVGAARGTRRSDIDLSRGSALSLTAVVIASATIRINQRVVRLADLRESGCRRRLRVHIRMIFARQAAISGFDLVRIRRAVDAQHGI